MDRDQVLFRLFGKFCPEGTILFTEGSRGEELYLIQGGAVRLGDQRAPGGSAQLGPGDLLGEEAFTGPAVRTARAEIAADARLIQVSDRTLGAVVRHGPEVGRQLLGRLLERACAARRDLAAWSVEHLMPRLAPELDAAARGGVEAGELAERTGTAVADVRLALDELVRRGGLARAGARYTAPDPERLQRAVDEMLAAGGRA